MRQLLAPLRRGRHPCHNIPLVFIEDADTATHRLPQRQQACGEEMRYKGSSVPDGVDHLYLFISGG